MSPVIAPSTIRRLIETQWAELEPVSIDLLGAGLDSEAFLVNGHWVFRFPQREDVERRMIVEARVLAGLQGSPLSVPQVSFLGRPSSLFPRHFMAYALLPGVPAIQHDVQPAAPGRLGASLGRFLSWLHRLPVGEALALGVEPVGLGDLMAALADQANEQLSGVGVVDREAPVGEWRRYLSHLPPAAPHPPVLLHNDFAAEHVLIDPSDGMPSGVIDWTNVAIGDPAIDFAAFFHWGGEPLAAAARTAYALELDAAQWQSARFIAACRGAGDVAFGRDTGRSEYVAAGLRALRLCAH